MTIHMNDSHMVSISQLKEFLKVVSSIDFRAASRAEKYAWVNNTLTKFNYFRLKKKGKVILKSYLCKMTGYSDPQIKRLITRKRLTGTIRLAENYGQRHSFATVYTPEDIALLAHTDNAHNRLSGPATKRLFVRAFQIFSDQRFARLKDISVGHIYNLRGKRQYRSQSRTFSNTQAVQRSIGLRKKPDPGGKPGFLRVDTVHQGDLDREKGVYHINLVDEVTQWEVVGCVEKISERFLLPLLADCLAQFPFAILGFHSDNGSEFINRTVARLLNKLLIEQTKSRSRQTNDNGLVEGKNGSVIRKWMGYTHIPGQYAESINRFYKSYLNVYLNFHRPSGFATTVTDRKGKQRKIYATYLTPYEKLKSLQNWARYLAPGRTQRELHDISLAKSDTEFAEMAQKAKAKLFKKP